MSKYALIVGAICLLGAGMLAICGQGLSEIWLGAASSGWPVTSGRVTQSAVVSELSRVDKKVLHASEPRTNSSLVTLYEAAVTYDYEVGGRSYQTKRVTIADGILVEDRQVAERVIARYPVGAGVAVHYKPDQPDMAVLETGISEGAQGTLVLGLTFSMIVGGLLVFVLSEQGQRVVGDLTGSRGPGARGSQPSSRSKQRKRSSRN